MPKKVWCPVACGQKSSVLCAIFLERSCQEGGAPRPPPSLRGRVSDFLLRAHTPRGRGECLVFFESEWLAFWPDPVTRGGGLSKRPKLFGVSVAEEKILAFFHTFAYKMPWKRWLWQKRICLSRAGGSKWLTWFFHK